MLSSSSWFSLAISDHWQIRMAEKRANSVPELESAFNSCLTPRQRSLVSKHCGPLKTIVTQTETPSNLNNQKQGASCVQIPSLLQENCKSRRDKSLTCILRLSRLPWAQPTTTTCCFYKTAFETCSPLSILYQGSCFFNIFNKGGRLSDIPTRTDVSLR